MQTGLTLEYPHLCEQEDLARRRSLRFEFLPGLGWAKVSTMCSVLIADQAVRMTNRVRRADGRYSCPSQQANALWGSLYVTAILRGHTNVKHAVILFAVTSTSPVALLALSYLLFPSEPLSSRDICSKMKAAAKSECQYSKCGQTRRTNGRVSVAAWQSSFKWKVTVPHCVLEKWPFLIRQQGTHLSRAH